MNLSSFSYLLKEGIKNLIHNKLMSLASIGVLTASLLVVGFSTLIGENLNKIIDFVGEQSSATIFLKDGTNEAKVDELTNIIKSNNKTKDTQYISKAQALDEFSKRLGNSAVNQFLLEQNTLPASIVVTAKNITYLEEILTSIKDMDCIEELYVPSNISQTIKEIEKTLGWFEITLIIALIIVALVIISNTIRATVFARRREIAIMKQVGATDNFVRFPFIVEGMIIGLLSSIIAFSIISIVYNTIVIILTSSESPFLNSMFSNFVSFKKIGFMFAINFTIGGMGAGVLGSLLSLKKYLKS